VTLGHLRKPILERDMKFSRRHVFRLAAGVASQQTLFRSARAEAYPSRAVRVIVGFPAGGVNDIVARLIAQRLSEHLSQRFLIENRPGASSNIATEAVTRARPDGYTLMLIGPPNVINATLYDNLSFNFLSDIVGVAAIVRTPNVMEVTPSFPAKTVQEFITYAKNNPGLINMGSSGTGTSQHLAGELFKMMAGVDLLHVPYRGNAPALTDLIGGQVHVMFDPVLSSIEHIRSGRLRALAVTSLARLDVLPSVPTVSDFIPGYEASSTYGIGAPRNTSPDVVDILNATINAILSEPQMKARLADMGGTPLAGSPADFANIIAEETEKWGKIIKASGAKPE
jgi:tripartite-type tricarboxylate transporter receptor subunit TctC